MKINYKLTLAAAVISVAMPTLSSAQEYTKSIVLDSSGNAVTTRDGTCVVHDFPENSNNICQGKTFVDVDALSLPNVVYFGFDKSGLDSRGLEVVNAVAAGLGELPTYNIKLSGHTDTVASNTYNQALSERRAASVKAALVARGIDASRITTASFGESQNAVPTKDAVPEALNRRVEIEITK
jgi:outer membrane protein OmpA-like peptidoglycan-associated protein